MEGFFFKLISEQGTLVGVCLFFAVGLSWALMRVWGDARLERTELLKTHKQERDDAWHAYNELLQKNVDATNKLSSLIEVFIKTRS